MKCCTRCGRIHVGLLIYATPMFRFLFQQDFEQWCDEYLDDSEIAKIVSLPLFKGRITSSLRSFMEMANTVRERDVQ